MHNSCACVLLCVKYVNVCAQLQGILVGIKFSSVKKVKQIKVTEQIAQKNVFSMLDICNCFVRNTDPLL